MAISPAHLVPCLSEETANTRNDPLNGGNGAVGLNLSFLLASALFIQFMPSLVYPELLLLLLRPAITKLQP